MKLNTSASGPSVSLPKTSKMRFVKAGAVSFCVFVLFAITTKTLCEQAVKEECIQNSLSYEHCLGRLAARCTGLVLP